jgi:hypothetical protein
MAQGMADEFFDAVRAHHLRMKPHSGKHTSHPFEETFFGSNRCPILLAQIDKKLF